MNLEVDTNKDVNHTQSPQMDDIKNPTEEDYKEDNVARSEVGA